MQPWFEEAPRKTNAYLREPGYVADTLNAPGRDAIARLGDLKELHASLVADRPLGLSACVRWVGPALFTHVIIVRQNTVQLKTAAVLRVTNLTV